MADDIDHASEQVDLDLKLALNRMQQNAAISGQGTEFCTECGDDMPEGRRKLGFKRCVPCAEEIERKKQLFAN